MYSMSVLCPLCAQTSFSSIDALRCSLIKAANGPLACPICHELFLGLDKLTIHLFSHTNIMNSANENVNATATPTPTPTPAPHNQQNIENIEKSKMQQNENLNNINDTSKNCNDTKIIQINTNDKMNFDNTTHHHHVWEENMIKTQRPTTTNANKTIVNKLNSTQQHQDQHQQVGTGTTTGEEQGESKEIESIAQCDICEFTFRNEKLRNMHIRLVHQNFKYHRNINDEFKNKTLTSTTTTTTPSSSSSSPSSSSSSAQVNDCQISPMDYDFKCHLCSKTFRTKGSLRVHLKVVHLMGLPYANNTQKLTICDRIRHKENKILKSTLNPTSNDVTQLQDDNTSINTTAANADYKSASNCNILNITAPVSFLSNLNSVPAAAAAAAANISVVNLNQSLNFQHDNAGLQTPNVLLVLNTSAPAEVESKFDSISNNGNSNTIIQTDIAATTPKVNEPVSKVISNIANVTENPKIWECDVCSKAFTTKYFLKKHKRLHTGEMPYTCELCARTFTFQQSYHKHLLYHSDEKPHVCSTCGRAFKELSTLHNHERIHSGEKPFKCEVCGKSFRQRVSFLVHTRIHTGVMPYKCELCQRSFRYKVSQRTHKCQPFSTEELQMPQDEIAIDNVSENFIKAFLESSTANQEDQHLNQSQNSPSSNEIAAINEKIPSLNEQQALLAKTIDDIVVESCNKMGIGSNGFISEQMTNEGSVSPSQKFQNMRLYSPQMVTPDINAIDGDLTRFFLENPQAANNLL